MNPFEVAPSQLSLSRHNSRVALRDNSDNGCKRDFSFQSVCDRIDCQIFHYLVSYITGRKFHVGEVCYTIYHCKIIINIPCMQCPLRFHREYMYNILAWLEYILYGKIVFNKHYN